jgi:putative hydrolase of the HAD superfamily
MKYKALLMDLDDTLTKSSKVYNIALEYAAKFLSDKYNLDATKFFELAKEKYIVISRNFPTVHTRHSRILVFRQALDEVMSTSYDLSLLPEVEEIYWEYFLRHIELYDEVIPTLAKIKGAGIKLAIVSDGGLELRIRKAQAVGLLPYIDEVVASEEVIFEKPFSAIFTLALSKLKTDPEHAVMLGNNYKNDIRGAQMVGIRAGIFDPVKDGNVEGQDGSTVEDFRITEFPQILDELGIS